jgi:hypothetical protein
MPYVDALVIEGHVENEGCAFLVPAHEFQYKWQLFVEASVITK